MRRRCRGGKGGIRRSKLFETVGWGVQKSLVEWFTGIKIRGETIDLKDHIRQPAHYGGLEILKCCCQVLG